jgi:agmatinase
MRSRVFHYRYLSALLGATQASKAWEFPRTSGYYSTIQKPLGGGSDVDIAYGSQFSGLTTYANIPYVNCFSDKASAEDQSSKYDIAILGAPFDTVGYLLKIITLL